MGSLNFRTDDSPCARPRLPGAFNHARCSARKTLPLWRAERRGRRAHWCDRSERRHKTDSGVIHLGLLVQNPLTPVALIRLDLDADALRRVGIRGQNVDATGVPQRQGGDIPSAREFRCNEVLARNTAEDRGESFLVSHFASPPPPLALSQPSVGVQVTRVSCTSQQSEHVVRATPFSDAHRRSSACRQHRVWRSWFARTPHHRIAMAFGGRGQAVTVSEAPWGMRLPRRADPERAKSGPYEVLSPAEDGPR